MTDTKINKTVRHKRLINILYEFRKLYQLRLLFRWIFRLISIGIVYTILNALIGCEPDRIEVWNVVPIIEPDTLIQKMQNIIDTTQYSQ